MTAIDKLKLLVGSGAPDKGELVAAVERVAEEHTAMEVAIQQLRPQQKTPTGDVVILNECAGLGPSDPMYWVLGCFWPVP